MIDGAHLPFEENIAITKKVVEVAHPVNVSVEAELGTIGTADDYGEAGSKKIIYTEVDDAVKFIKETDIDCLAIAIGTAHGLYPKDRKPKLALDRLKEIKAAVSIPLVLHGGSGNPDDEIAQSVKLGVNKINISSDIKDAFYQECRIVLQDKAIREPMAIYPKCIDAMNEVIRHKINLFDDADKVKFYK